MMARHRFVSLLSFAWFTVSLPTGAIAGSDQKAVRSLSVAVAANMKPAFEEIAARFERQTPGVEVKAVFGAAGSFVAQIANGAPFDLFLSADPEFPAKLSEKGFAEGTPFLYAYGKLVVWVPTGSVVDLEKRGIEALADPSVKKIAIANPDVAPYGRAAREVLSRAKLWDRFAGRIVLGQNVSQAAQFVQSGNAQAGFLPLSLTLVPPLSREGRAWLVPPASHGRIEQAGIVVKGARQVELARDLATFMRGDAAREVLRKHGYDLPPR